MDDQDETASGAERWETFFEAAPNGIIPLVGQARSARALHQCTHLVVDCLFTRAEDIQRRDAFRRVIDNVLPPPEANGPAVDKAKDQLVEVFRYIKEDRIAKAADYQARQSDTDGADDLPATDRRTPDPEPEPEDGPAHIAPHDPRDELEILADDDDATGLFCHLFWDVVRERLDTLRAGMIRADQEKVVKPVPFMLSADFAEVFGAVVMEHIAPDVADKARTIIRSAERLSPDERPDHIAAQLADPNNRRVLWEAWQLSWKARTRQHEPPPKPKVEPKKKGALGLLGKTKKAKAPAFMNKAPQMTMEEWRAEVRRLEKANTRAAKIWAMIVAPSDVYDPPADDARDNEFLMELFGRSVKGLNDQMNALRQIAAQGGQVGRAFDTFRRGKYPDLALLCATVRFPEDLLRGNPSPLKQILRGFRKSELIEKMPYTWRWLQDYVVTRKP